MFLIKIKQLFSVPAIVFSFYEFLWLFKNFVGNAIRLFWNWKTATPLNLLMIFYRTKFPFINLHKASVDWPEVNFKNNILTLSALFFPILLFIKPMPFFTMGHFIVIKSEAIVWHWLSKEVNEVRSYNVSKLFQWFALLINLDVLLFFHHLVFIVDDWIIAFVTHFVRPLIGIHILH